MGAISLDPHGLAKTIIRTLQGFPQLCEPNKGEYHWISKASRAYEGHFKGSDNLMKFIRSSHERHKTALT